MKIPIAWPACFLLGCCAMTFAQEKAAPDAAKSPAAATKENPFVNSLGMKFVPVEGTKVLFSIWDTRVKDYRVFAEANPGVDTKWKNVKFPQTEDHPVVDVSWEDAKAFCAWLTKKEREEGRIGKNQEYCLPTDKEWSAAAGKSLYPWGDQWPPPMGAGNYDPSFNVDGFDNTSPVGSFNANQYGLYDMGGNVWQLCEDWFRKDMNDKALLENLDGEVRSALEDDGGGKKYRVVRGSSWMSDDPGDLFSSLRAFITPDSRGGGNIGFRCVLAPVPPSP